MKALITLISENYTNTVELVVRGKQSNIKIANEIKDRIEEELHHGRKCNKVEVRVLDRSKLVNKFEYIPTYNN